MLLDFYVGEVHFDGMDYSAFASAIFSAVFFANVLTLAFVWGLNKSKDGENHSFMVLAALGLPLIFFALSLVSTGQLPPSLDALVAQQSVQP